MAKAKAAEAEKAEPTKRSKRVTLYGHAIDVVLELLEKAYFDKKTPAKDKTIIGKLLGKLQ